MDDHVRGRLDIAVARGHAYLGVPDSQIAVCIVDERRPNTNGRSMALAAQLATVPATRDIDRFSTEPDKRRHERRHGLARWEAVRCIQPTNVEGAVSPEVAVRRAVCVVGHSRAISHTGVPSTLSQCATSDSAVVPHQRERDIVG